MPSRTKRREVRRKRRAQKDSSPVPIDRHTAVIMQTMAEAIGLLAEAPDGEAALPWLEQQLQGTVSSLATGLGRYGAFAVCEVARMNFLPWNFMQGANFMDTDGGPARIELLTLLAASSETPRDPEAPPIWHQIASWKEQVDKIIQMSSLIHLHRSTSDGTYDPMARIQSGTRNSEVLLRESSYSGMVESTLRQLFNEPSVKNAIIDLLAFDFECAFTVLKACDAIQTDKMSLRLNSMFSRIEEAMENQQDLLPEDFEQLHEQLNNTWDPADEEISVSPSEIAAKTGISLETIDAILSNFTVGTNLGTPYSEVDRFTSGDNLLRTKPLLTNGEGKAMLVHPSLFLPAIRENFEEHLRKSRYWNLYQSHRGKYLEVEAEACLSLMFPGAGVLSGFEYFIPANEAEEQGPTDGYTKLVEGDLLFLLDDVAIITEAKAVSLAATARAGHAPRLKSDLTRIITKAAEQANRLKARIEKDRGFRLRDGTWINTGDIREIHTIALSLDDLSGVSTATTDLLEASLLDANSIPWTVSLNDLKLITQLIDYTATAVFLLYLR